MWRSQAGARRGSDGVAATGLAGAHSSPSFQVPLNVHRDDFLCRGGWSTLFFQVLSLSEVQLPRWCPHVVGEELHAAPAAGSSAAGEPCALQADFSCTFKRKDRPSAGQECAQALPCSCERPRQRPMSLRLSTSSPGARGSCVDVERAPGRAARTT